MLKNDIKNRIKSIQNEAINNLIHFANETAKLYLKELSVNSKIKKQELDRIVKEKKNAEEIQKTIENMQMILNGMEPTIKAVRERKEGIDANI